jgi:2-iminobutanoate/2-iminopropanoate deaminase
MPLQAIRTEKAPAAIGPYSQGIAAGSWCFVSGQIGLDPTTGELVGTDFASQARQAIENMRQIVEAGGASLAAVTAVDVYVTDIKNFAEFNQIYQAYFETHHPARALVEVSALPKGALVELKCIVYRG